MAERRMMSKKITNSARFIKMPTDSQALYLHLCNNADDDGVVEAYSILKLTGIREDNLRVLASKEFIKVLNDDFVSYIMDWTEHNQIRPDRKVNSIYKDLLISILPDVELVEPTPRTDVKNNNKRLGNGQSTDSPRTVHNNKKDKKNGVDSPRTAEYRVVEGSIVENSIGENTLSDFSTKNAEVEKNSSISEKKENLISSENSKAEALPKKRTFKNPDDEIISEVIDAFKPINPLYANCYKRKVEKDAILDLIKVVSKEDLLDIVKNKLPVTNKEKFAPTITKPSELANKWAGLKTFLETNPNLFSEKPFEISNINSSEDQEAYLMNEGNPQYKTFDIPWNELSEDERNKFLENEVIRKKYKDAPFSPKEINFKEFAKDFSVKKTSTLTKEDIKKIPLIDF